LLLWDAKNLSDHPAPKRDSLRSYIQSSRRGGSGKRFASRNIDRSATFPLFSGLPFCKRTTHFEHGRRKRTKRATNHCACRSKRSANHSAKPRASGGSAHTRKLLSNSKWDLSPNFTDSAKHALLFISFLKQVKASLVSVALPNVFLAFQPSKRGLIGIRKQPKPGTRTGGKLLDAFTCRS
jgi:hypothetical protein